MKRPFSERESQALFSLRALGLLSSLMLVPVLAGCPGTLDPRYLNATGGGTGGMTGTGGTAGPPCDAPTMVFMPTCVSMNCHLPTGFFPPDFSIANSAALKTYKASALSLGCAGKTLVDSTALNPLIARISGSTCGEQMPDKAIDMTVSYLTPDQITCVSSWVAAQ